MSKFNKLKLSSQWHRYLDNYPGGYTIAENLIDWVSQVNKMVDNVNDWNKYLDDFVETFDEKIQPTVEKTLDRMEKDGTLENIINYSIFEQKPNIYVDSVEPINPPDNSFWYEVKGDPPIDFNGDNKGVV